MQNRTQRKNRKGWLELQIRLLFLLNPPAYARPVMLESSFRFKNGGNMSFVMYSTTWCGYCKRLKNQLARMDISFQEINIEEVEGSAEIVEKVNNGNRTVPTLVFSDGSAMTNPSAQQVADKLAELS